MPTIDMNKIKMFRNKTAKNKQGGVNKSLNSSTKKESNSKKRNKR
jgi:hypothetical protein